MGSQTTTGGYALCGTNILHLLVYNLFILQVQTQSQLFLKSEVSSLPSLIFDNKIEDLVQNGGENPADHTSNSLPTYLPVLNKDIYCEDCSDSNFPSIYNSGFRLCAWFVFLLWIKELNNGVRAVSAVLSCIMFTTIRYHIGPGQIHHHTINHQPANTIHINSEPI